MNAVNMLELFCGFPVFCIFYFINNFQIRDQINSLSQKYVLKSTIICPMFQVHYLTLMIL